MPSTSNYSLPYPSDGDAVDVPGDIQALAEAADTAVLDVDTAKLEKANGTATAPREAINIVATSVPATLNIDTDTSATWYYTTASAANFTVNVRRSSGATLNSLMAAGEAMQVTLLVTNTTARSITSFTVDGAATTSKWINGGAAPSGNASAVDQYTFIIVKTAAATFHTFLSLTKYA